MFAVAGGVQIDPMNAAGGFSSNRERLDQFTRFFMHKPPQDQYAFFESFKQLFGVEVSSAICERGDLRAYQDVVYCIVENVRNGQIDLAHDFMIRYINDLRATQSLEGGTFLRELLSHKIEYSQRQDVHEYVHPADKKKWFGGKD